MDWISNSEANSTVRKQQVGRNPRHVQKQLQEQEQQWAKQRGGNAAKSARRRYPTKRCPAGEPLRAALKHAWLGWVFTTTAANRLVNI